MVICNPATPGEPAKRFLTTVCLGPYQNFEDFFDYGHIRYHTVLAYNECYPNCEENKRLHNLYHAFKAGNDELIDAESTHCSLIFKDYIEKNYEERVKMGSNESFVNDTYTATKFPVVKIQAKTVSPNNEMRFMAHSSMITYPATSPIENTFRDIPRVFRKDVVIHQEIWREIFHARISDNDYCVKTIYHYFDEASFRQELETLWRAPVHPNISCLVAVVAVDEGVDSKIDGIVLSLINDGKRLSEIRKLEEAPADKWKSQIADAVIKLHEKGLVWGCADVKNVIIDKNQNAIVVDFAGGSGQKSKAADMEGLSRIFKFIDKCVERNTRKDWRVEMFNKLTRLAELRELEMDDEAALVDYSFGSTGSMSGVWR